jgi:hypothetical protein
MHWTTPRSSVPALPEKDVKRRLIHVVGLQKSGTSLLVRLLENSGHARFLDGKGKTEGGIDWGHRPSFSPAAWPAGTIYQRSNGENGHEIGAEDATRDICEAVRTSTAEKLNSVPTQFGVSKIPYDMVRLPWVRAVLPDLFIVGIVRRPVPNVYSLWKRFQPNSGRNSIPSHLTRFRQSRAFAGTRPRR